MSTGFFALDKERAKSAIRSGSGPIRVATERTTGVLTAGWSQSSSGIERNTGPAGGCMAIT